MELEPYPWFALRVRSKHERVTSLHLQRRGFEEFSPSYRAESQWSDRKKTTDRFLFPGYVFCRFNPRDRLPILTAPGVVGLVGFGDGPTPIPDIEIEQVRTMVQSGLLVTPWPFLELGQTVRLESGPLRGLEGIVEEVKGRLRLSFPFACCNDRSRPKSIESGSGRSSPPRVPKTRLITDRISVPVPIRALVPFRIFILAAK